LIDLRDFVMPLYDGDLEQEHGPPEAATRLFELMKAHDGLLLACPEYNSSITPLLKNTIDWVSRPREGEPRLAAFTGKVAALTSASTGQLGGLRGLVHVRSILSNIGVFVVPNQVAVSSAHEAFDDAGAIQDETLVKRIEGVVMQLIQTTEKLAPTK
jgi:NAD(P)H-dependent FMN reductase